MNKKFTYNISWEDLPHTQETVQEAFGTDYFNSDFPIDTHAIESISNLFQDAIAQCISFKLHALANENLTSKDFIKYQDEKIKFYEKVRDSLKLVSIE